MVPGSTGAGGATVGLVSSGSIAPAFQAVVNDVAQAGGTAEAIAVDLAGEDDWPRLAGGTAAGHLLECGGQVTGAYFADPGFKEVPNLADCGYPIAEVGSDLMMVLTAG